ncbi:bifunctional DNA primase/polymerase [Nocardia sp. NBC_01730]|uniref:bifunctional DNA primase/polymerase n=1 Tax=Nocardia sp. NBC_01730 TaxID=2975998 RepID=UPI003FA38DB2
MAQVNPLVPLGKTPAVRGWDEWATTDPDCIHRYWADGGRNNLGIVTGRRALLSSISMTAVAVTRPKRSAGARHGRDALALLATRAGEEAPTDTYAVATPAGFHLYFRASSGLALRNTTAKLGWRIA